MDDVEKSLANANVGNYSAIKDSFTAYAQGEWQSAITFLSTWVGTSYTGSPPTTTTAAATTTTSAQPTSVGQPTCDCKENGRTPQSPECCYNGTCDQDGTCSTANCD